MNSGAVSSLTDIQRSKQDSTVLHLRGVRFLHRIVTPNYASTVQMSPVKFSVSYETCFPLVIIKAYGNA